MSEPFRSTWLEASGMWLRMRWAAFIVGPLVALVVIVIGCFVGRT